MWFKREDRFLTAFNNVGQLIKKGIDDVASLAEDGVGDFFDFFDQANQMLAPCNSTTPAANTTNPAFA